MSRELRDFLNDKYYETLTQLLKNSDKYEAQHLFEASTKHADYALEKFEENPIIDFEAAERLATVITELQGRWASLNPQEQQYLKAAMYYFAVCEDEDSDFDSFTGFDDDVLVLNACLRYAGLDELVISLKR